MTMYSRGWIAAAFLAIAATGWGAEQTVRIGSFATFQHLCADPDDRLILLIAGRIDLDEIWQLPDDAVGKTVPLRLLQQNRDGDWVPHAVGYDPATKQAVLREQHPQATATEWIVTGDARKGIYFQAAAGKLKGWYLTAAEPVEEAENGRTIYRCHRVVLTEKATEHSVWGTGEVKMKQRR
jgi:hypothetical protein